jgi:hypothetical protein
LQEQEQIRQILIRERNRQLQEQEQIRQSLEREQNRQLREQEQIRRSLERNIQLQEQEQIGKSQKREQKNKQPIFKERKYMNEDKEQLCCSICLENFVIHEIIYELQCMHIYHKSCITKWLDINKNCPYCRKNFE